MAVGSPWIVTKRVIVEKTDLMALHSHVPWDFLPWIKHKPQQLFSPARNAEENSFDVLGTAVSAGLVWLGQWVFLPYLSVG